MLPIDFIQLESTLSTNTWAKEHARELNPQHITCITAREQTGGRGRQNKKWISPKDANLYLTLYFVVPAKASYLSNLGQIMALSVSELLCDMHVHPELKWPNDILVSNKKIGGVLTETIPLDEGIAVILGVGLNIHMPQEILNTIDQPATSLHLILQKNISPQSLVQPLLEHFTTRLAKLQSMGFASFQPRYQELLARKGELITVKLPQNTVRGICDSVTMDGLLKIQLPSGEFLTLSIGEII